jgi:hypothetical protein
VWSSRRPRSQEGEGYASCFVLPIGTLLDGVFAVEGTGSLGAGLTRFLVNHEERVLEVAGCDGSGKHDCVTAADPTAFS